MRAGFKLFGFFKKPILGKRLKGTLSKLLLKWSRTVSILSHSRVQETELPLPFSQGGVFTSFLDVPSRY